jgi:hypothetical protein
VTISTLFSSKCDELGGFFPRKSFVEGAGPFLLYFVVAKISPVKEKTLMPLHFEETLLFISSVPLLIIRKSKPGLLWQNKIPKIFHSCPAKLGEIN